MASVAEFWHRIERSLFPCAGENLGQPLTEELQKPAAVLEVLRIEEMPVYRPATRRPHALQPSSRRARLRCQSSA